MKKITSFILVVCFLLMVGACSGKKTTSTTENTTTNTTTVDPLANLSLDNNLGAYYQIFVRSFADSNGDGIGDINGIKENIDYIADLGFEGIWLMPFCEAVSYHGYDVTDYYNVDTDYGTNEDLKALIDVCHEKGIKVIMDFVLNHTSEEHEWFKAAKAGDTKYQDYYVLASNSDDRISKHGSYWHYFESGKKYYGYFSNTMPDLNYANQNVFNEIVEIAKFWADLGMDGYRLDGAFHIAGQGEYKDGSTVKTSVSKLELLRMNLDNYFTSTLGKDRPYFVAEVYDESASYSTEYYVALESCFDFWGAKHIKNAVNASVGKSYASKIQSKIEDYYESAATYGLTAINAPFISNHDQDRFASVVVNEKLLHFGAELLLTQEGNPFVYYGEEIGMKGIKTEGPDIWDETRRLPFLWGVGSCQTTWYTDTWGVEDTYNTDVATYNEQKNDATSLYNTYKKLLNLRKDSIALKYGKFEALSVELSNLSAFTRTYTEGDFRDQVIVIHNFSGDSELGSLQEFYTGDNVLYYSEGTFDGTMSSKTTLILQIGSAK